MGRICHITKLLDYSISVVLLIVYYELLTCNNQRTEVVLPVSTCLVLFFSPYKILPNNLNTFS